MHDGKSVRYILEDTEDQKAEATTDSLKIEDKLCAITQQQTKGHIYLDHCNLLHQLFGRGFPLEVTG